MAGRAAVIRARLTYAVRQGGPATFTAASSAQRDMPSFRAERERGWRRGEARSNMKRVRVGTIARVALQSRGPSGRESRSSRAAPSPRTFGCGRRHERANSEGRTSPDACFLGEQERRARRSSRPPRVSRQRVLPRDCASQGRRPHGPRPARSRLCSRGVRRTASRCCVSSDPVTRPAPALAPAHSGNAEVSVRVR